jgi:phage terminase large subunit
MKGTRRRARAGAAAPVEPVKLVIPAAFDEIWRPCRYKVFHGGRGSAKSWTVAGVLVWLAARVQIRVLCARELQGSMADSVHRLLTDQIMRLGLAHEFEVTINAIRAVRTGSEFMFKGLRHNVMEIKSTEGVDICWVEEAQRVTAESWQVLIPTIRKPGSEIWVTFNPDSEEDPTYQRFVMHPPDGALVRQVNFDGNPFFPDVLRDEMEYLKKVDFEAFEHVWLGQPKARTKAQIFAGKYRVDVFEPPEGATFYYGADWGFAQDPTTLIRCFIHDRKLWIDQEAYGVGVELDETARLFNSVPGARRARIRADNGRPETINHVNKRGFKIERADKWAGSVEDGIDFLRSFEQIVIHERCKHMAEEAKLYSYKVDKVGEILPVVVDRHNHCWDAVRYALDPLIQQGLTGLLEYFRQEVESKASAPDRATQQGADNADEVTKWFS